RRRVGSLEPSRASTSRASNRLTLTTRPSIHAGPSTHEPTSSHDPTIDSSTRLSTRRPDYRLVDPTIDSSTRLSTRCLDYRLVDSTIDDRLVDYRLLTDSRLPTPDSRLLLSSPVRYAPMKWMIGAAPVCLAAALTLVGSAQPPSSA